MTQSQDNAFRQFMNSSPTEFMQSTGDVEVLHSLWMAGVGMMFLASFLVSFVTTMNLGGAGLGWVGNSTMMYTVTVFGGITTLLFYLGLRLMPDYFNLTGMIDGMFNFASSQVAVFTALAGAYMLGSVVSKIVFFYVPLYF